MWRGFFNGRKRTQAIGSETKKRIAELTEEEVVLEKRIIGAKNETDRGFFRNEKERIRWELETFIIQKSTKTTIPQFLRLHDKLRMKYRWYYNWHLLPYAGKVHWAALFTSLSLFISLLIIMSFIAVKPISAAGNTRTWDGEGADGTCGGNVGDGNKWTCALNWSDDTVPEEGDLVIFNVTSTKDSTIDASISLVSFTVSVGYTGTISLASNSIKLTVTSDLQQAGANTIDVNGGEIETDNLWLDTDLWTNGSRIQDSGNGKITVNSNFGILNAAANFAVKTLAFSGGSENDAYMQLDEGATVSIGTFVADRGAEKTANIQGDLTVANEFDILSGTLAMSGQTLTVTNNVFSNDGTLRLNGQETLNFTKDVGSGEIEYYGNAETINGLVYGGEYWDLQVYGDTMPAASTWKLSQNTLVNGNFTNGPKSNFDCNGFNLTIGGNTTNTSNFYTGEGTITFGDAPGDSLTIGQNFVVESADTAKIVKNAGNLTLSSPMVTYASAAPTETDLISWLNPYWLTINSTGSTYNLTALITSSKIDIDHGTLDVTDQNYTINTMNFTNDDTFVSHEGTVLITAGGGQLGSLNEGAGTTFYNVTLQDGTTGLYGQGLYCSGSLQMNAGTGVNLNGKDLTVDGNFNVSGTIEFNGTETVSVPTLNSGSSVIYDGADTAFQNWNYMNADLIMYGGTFTLPAALTFHSLDQEWGEIIQGGNELTIIGNTILYGTLTGGTADINIGGNLDNFGEIQSTSAALSVAGNWNNQGTFNDNGGTVGFNGANGSTQTVSGSTTFNNLEITTANNTTGRTVQFEGGSTQTISGTLSLLGYSGKILTLQSTDGTDWNINPTSTQAGFIDISHVNNLGPSFTAPNSTGHDNTNIVVLAPRHSSHGTKLIPSPSQSSQTTVVVQESAEETPSPEPTSRVVNLPQSEIESTPYVIFGETFIFDGTKSTSGPGIKYSWEFGDGESSNLARVEHKYAQPGRYIVKLTITEASGNKDTSSITVEVKPPAPEITEVKVVNNDLQIKGKAYANSTVVLTIYSDPHTFTINADTNGLWQYTIQNFKSILGQGAHEVRAVSSIALPDQAKLESLPAKNYTFQVNTNENQSEASKKNSYLKFVLIGIGLVGVILLIYFMFKKLKK